MKLTTNLHWARKAREIKNDVNVNIADINQRDLENKIICSYLNKKMFILEVGCGNGYSTSIFRKLVKFIDAFDYSKDMINRAKRVYGESNNRFFVDNILDPQYLSSNYDMIICVRVLINLRDFSEQEKALLRIASLIKQGRIVILIEGFKDGFAEINKLRQKIGLPPIQPADINFYSRVEDLRQVIEQNFLIEEEFHLGSYDYLTRVVYPLFIGSENVRHNTKYHEKSKLLASIHNPPDLKSISRIRGFLLKRK